MTKKRLYRSRTNRVFAGICGGLGQHFDIDPVIIRLIWLLVVIFTGFVPGLLAYIFAIFIIPEEPVHHASHATHSAHTEEKPEEKEEK